MRSSGSATKLKTCWNHVEVTASVTELEDSRLARQAFSLTWKICVKRACPHASGRIGFNGTRKVINSHIPKIHFCAALCWKCCYRYLFSGCRSCNDMIFFWYKKFVIYLKQQLIHLLTLSTLQLGKLHSVALCITTVFNTTRRVSLCIYLET